MKRKITKGLIIIPMLLFLCFSFINVKAYATDEISNNSNISKTEDTDINNNKNNISKTSENSTSSNTEILSQTNTSSPTGSGNVIITSEKNGNDKDGQEDTKQEVKKEEIFSGWKEVNGKLYYFTKDEVINRTGWFKEKDINKDSDNNNEYYLDKDHSAVVGWKEINKLWYYFNEAGVKQTGWILSNYNWYHLTDDGIMETGWIKVDNYTYYLDQSGIMVTGKKYLDGKLMYFTNGGILAKGIYEIGNKRYYSDKNGEIVSNKWVNVGNKKYYIKADGSIATGSTLVDGAIDNFDSNGKYIGSGDINDGLYIKFLNVGNADCAFIRLPDGETVLIDTGAPETSDELVNFLNKQNLRKENGKKVIDYIILSHGHSDHIGGVPKVLENFNVKKVYMPEIAKMEDWYSGVDEKSVNKDSLDMLKSDYKVHVDLMNVLKEKNIKLTNTIKGDKIDSNGILTFVQSDKKYPPLGSEKILQEYWALNDDSDVVYLDYKDLQVLFTGDMEWNSEKDFWQNNLLNNKEVDILKVPHHGNNTSSTPDFISYLKPQFGVISRDIKTVNPESLSEEGASSGNNNAYSNLISNGVNIYETSLENGVSVFAGEDGQWNIETDN